VLLVLGIIYKAISDALRDEYGRNQAGQRMLLARRLVEAGVRFVTLSYGGWDMHARIRDGITTTLPSFDQAFTASQIVALNFHFIFRFFL
jgi:hypothetical protein